MKNFLTIFFLAIGSQVHGQPIITNASNIPAAGLIIPFSSGVPTSGIGASGANQNWNFSALSFTPLGNITVITPSTSTFASSFPNSNYAYSFSGTYSYFSALTTKMEVMAYSITAPGSGNDYTPNPRTVLKFPFNYGDVETDTWQKVGGAVNNVTLTYDGYGTLITPTKTYTNVVRVKEDYGSSGIDYQWYILNPLISVLIYDHNTNALYSLDVTQTTGIRSQNSASIAYSVFPNPAKDYLRIHFNGRIISKNLNLSIINLYGQIVQKDMIKGNDSFIKLNNLPGQYFYQLGDENGVIQGGQLTIE